MKHSCRDICRHKCHFGLAFCSVFVVVLSVVVVNTIISKGPLIFLSLAEKQNGAFDGLFYNEGVGSDYSDFSNIYCDHNHNLNYTKILELYDDEFNLSPRMQFAGISANYSDNTGLEGFDGKLMTMDTVRENEI